MDPLAEPLAEPTPPEAGEPNDAVFAGGIVAEEIDWWSLEYDNLSDELVCPICKTAFVTPVTTKCGHTFCQECIESTRSSMHLFACPVDRQPILGAIDRSPYLVSGLVNDLVVKCPYSSRGCTFKGKRWLLASHVESCCQYVRVRCVPPCDKLVERRHYTENECSHTMAECPNDCGSRLSLTEIETHVNSVCGKQVVQCPDCLLEQTREDAADHAAQCEMAVVVCTGEPAGCKWSGLRKDVGDGLFHIESCPLAMVAPVLASQTRRIDALESENTSLRTIVELLRRQVRDMPQQDVHIMMEYERLRQEVDHVLSTSENHVKQLMMLARENVRITDDLSFVRNGMTSMRHQMHYLNLAQRRSMYPMPSYAPPDRNERPDRPDRSDRSERSSDGPRHDIKL